MSDNNQQTRPKQILIESDLLLRIIASVAAQNYELGIEIGQARAATKRPAPKPATPFQADIRDKLRAI